MNQLQRIKRLREILKYNPSTGAVSVAKSSRVLLPDEDGLVYVTDSQSKPKTKRYKLDRLAWIVNYATEIPDGYTILHKNLNTQDNRACNLACVTKEIYLTVNTARRNLEGGIRFKPHPSDQYSYILYWYEDGREKSKIFYALEELRKFMLNLQLINSKILTKYCVFDDA